MSEADEVFQRAQDLHLGGKVSESIPLYRSALEQNPNDAEGHFFLGLALFQTGKLTEAADSIRRAIGVDAGVAEFHCDLAKVLFQLGDFGGAIATSRRALELQPDFPEAQVNLGNALCRTRAFDEGIVAYRRAIELEGERQDVLNNLGMAHLTLGEIDAAKDFFGRAMKIDPNDAAAHSNLIYAMHFDSSSDAAAIRAELGRWNQQHAAALMPPLASYENERTFNRPLRIGYISPDFRDHVVGWNMLPLLREHDRERFHAVCYASVAEPDEMTGRLRSLVYDWRDIANKSDEEVARLVRVDQIDILVDLSLHTGGNRLRVMARKPAPIQVSYLGYPGSTGLDAIDYRFSDPWLDSDDELSEHTERTIRLPRTYWCYQPLEADIEPGPLPATSSGVITFGCLNQFQKLSTPALELWREILMNVANSRLLVHAEQGKCRNRLLELFERGGVERGRIEFTPRLSRARYLETYRRIDIALDPFPHGGGITTCDALWMGAPVITLRGKTGVGRAAASILRNLDLGWLIAKSEREYLSIARSLAEKIAHLAEIRERLRERFRGSVLMDPSAFARNIEAAYLEMWKKWHKSSQAL